MLRTYSRLRKLGWSMLAVLALHTGADQASAQAPPPPMKVEPIQAKADPASKVFVIPANVTKTIGMTKLGDEEPLIERVHNENPKVCKVQSIINDPRHVLITGIAPGISRVSFSGSVNGAKRDEIFEIRVPSDDEPLREQMRRDFLDAVKKGVPAANIDAMVAPNNTVILTGWLATPQDTQVVQALARSVFGPQSNFVDTMRVGGVHQVMVECTVAVVNRSKIRSATFNWVLNRRNMYVGSLLSASSFSNSIASGVGAAAATATGAPSNLIWGVVGDRGAFTGFLEALRTENMAKVHSEPKVVTLSGKEAEFVSGGETPLLTSSGQGAPSVSYRSFGTVVRVLPIILGNGKIHLDIQPQLSNRNDGNGIAIPGNAATVVPGFDTRSARVSVQLEDGQTMAIGGLIQHSVNGSVRKVPYLGDLPFIGAAFSSKTYDEREEEMIILVTPRLVDPMACSQLPERLPTRLTRTPDDFELFLEQLLELPRGQRQICGPDGRYQAAHKNGPTAGMYPCGDAVNCGTGCKTCVPTLNLRTGCAPCATGLGVCSPTSTGGACAPVTSATPAPAVPIAAPTQLPANFDAAPPTMPPPASPLPPLGLVSPTSATPTERTTDSSPVSQPLRLPGLPGSEPGQ